MKKIHNAWANLPHYNCYGCSPNNPHGLHMEFYEDGDDIVSTWKPTYDSQGWIDVLHGGIQAALSDEIASWVIFRKLQTIGVTGKMEVRYHKSISTKDPFITLRAHITEQRRSVVNIEVTIQDASGKVCTTTNCMYFIKPHEKAVEEGFQNFNLEEDEESLSK